MIERERNQYGDFVVKTIFIKETVVPKVEVQANESESEQESEEEV